MRILLSYKDHTPATGGGGVHGFHVVEQLRRFGHEIVTAERVTDERVEQRSRSPLAMARLLDEVDALYVRADARAWNHLLLTTNARTVRRPVVLELNAPPEEQLAFGTGPWRRARVRLRVSAYHGAARAAAAVTCVSDNLADHVRRTFPVRPEAVHVVPNGGVPVHAVPEPGPADRFRVLYTGGRTWPWQRVHDLVFEVAKRLHERVPHAELVYLTSEPAAQVRGLPGVSHHALVPYEQMPSLLASVDAALCLYRPVPNSPCGFYGSSLKLFDYMSAGLPVVATGLGQITQVIVDGESGFLVDDDPAAITARLVTLAEDPATRAAVGSGAWTRIREAWTWDHTGDRIQRMLETF